MALPFSDGFLLPSGVHPWGTRFSELGLEPAPPGRWPRAPGTVELEGLTLHDVSVGACRRGLVRAVDYEAHDPQPLVEVLGELGLPEHTHRPDAAGSEWAVVDVYEWPAVREVTVSVSVYGAPRDGLRAGLFVRCSNERLAAPFLPEPTPPWGVEGRMSPLGKALVEREITAAARVLDSPGLHAPAAWMTPGIWESAGFWGVGDTTRTTAIAGDAPSQRFRLHRLLPARGPGGAFLEHVGVGTVMQSSRPDGLDAVVEALRGRGVQVDIHEDHDA